MNPRHEAARQCVGLAIQRTPSDPQTRDYPTPNRDLQAGHLGHRQYSIGKLSPVLHIITVELGLLAWAASGSATYLPPPSSLCRRLWPCTAVLGFRLGFCFFSDVTFRCETVCLSRREAGYRVSPAAILIKIYQKRILEKIVVRAASLVTPVFEIARKGCEIQD